VSVREQIERRLITIPGLVAAPSRWGNGIAYHVGRREICHFHDDGRMDVRITKTVLRERKAEGALDPRIETRDRPTDWVTVRVLVREDVAFAVALVEDAVRANA
jgi:hypothetical protein